MNVAGEAWHATGTGLRQAMCCLHIQDKRTPEDEDRKFLQNIGIYLPNYIPSHPRRL
jgi:hypothetical protein